MEDKSQVKEKNNKLTLNHQRELYMTGISKILTSTESCISVMVNNQVVNIEGEKLCVKKIDIDNGILEADGFVHLIKYAKSKQKENLLKRIFS